MNPFIIGGICAGAFLYGGLRVLTRSQKRKGKPAAQAESSSAGKEHAEVVETLSEPAPTISEILVMEDEEIEARVEASESTEARTAEADPPPAEIVPDSALSDAFSGSKEKHWFLIESKDGKVRVCQAWEKTPKTIAGPFPTKEAAYKAKDS